MNELTFSVIIPTYNRQEPLRRSLQSLVAQTYKNFEVIVCDDGSTDHTEEVVKSFKNDLNIEYIWEENWGGPARPRNNGIRVASGEWICFLDSDDWWYSKKLETVERYLDTCDIDFVYHDLDIYTLKGKQFWRKIRGRQFTKSIFIALLENLNGIANSSVVARKKIIDQVGGLSEDRSLIAFEDYDLWLKISRVSEKFCYIPQTLGAYWNGGGNITEWSDRQIENVENIYNKYATHLSCQDKNEIDKTFNYTIGRIKQRMGCLEEALDLLNVSARSKRSSICLKSIGLILWIHIIKRYRK
ncbi:MAG: glycosyltransferase family 2 protein [Syntrophus sp. (in: bacteria)]